MTRSSTVAPLLAFGALLALGAPGGAQDAQRVEVLGRVLDRAFQPIEGALLGVRADRVGERPRSTAAILAEPRATTGADGRFRLELEPAADGSSQTVVIAARGCATVEVPSAGDLGDVVLPRGVTLVGSVRDDGGQLLVGVEVVIDDALRQVGPLRGVPRRSWSPRVVAVTDARGLFRADGALPVAARLRFSKPGYSSEELAPFAFGDPIVAELRSAGLVRGRLLDADGRPVATILTVSEDGARRGESSSVRSGEDGSFEVNIERGARIKIDAYVKIDGVVQTVSRGQIDEPVDGLVLNLAPIVRADRTSPLILEAVAAETGEPLPEFEAAAYWNQGVTNMAWEFAQRQVRSRMVAAVGGRAEVPAPTAAEPPSGVAFVGAPGRAWTRVEGVEWREEVAEHPLRVELPAEAVLRGRVVDPSTGGGVPYVRVAWVPDSGGRARYMRVRDRLVGALGEATSDADGRFELRRLPAEALELLAVAPGRPEIQVVRVHIEPDAAPDDLVIQAPAGATVRGRLAGLDGPAGFEVAVRPLQVDPQTYIGNLPVVDSALGEDGAFAIPALGPGYYVLELVARGSPRGGAEVRMPIQPFRVRPGGEAPRLVVDVAADVPSVLRGRLTVRGGALPRARLAIVAEDEVRQRFVNPSYATGPLALPDGGGRFEMVVAPGVHRLRVFDIANGIEVARVDGVSVDPATVTEADVDVEIVPLRVRLRPEQEGAPLGASRLEVWVDWPPPAGAGGVVAGRGTGDSGVGLDLSGDRVEFQLFVPPVETRLRVWRGRGGDGDDADAKASAPVVEEDVTPHSGRGAEVELVVPSRG